MQGGDAGDTLAPEPRLLLFDLGGVLVDHAGIGRLGEWLGVSSDDESLRTRWLTSPTVRAFELGRTTPRAFSERFVAEWNLLVSPSAFLAKFASWPKGWFPGAAALLRRLRLRFPLACLSNSNVVHWDRLDDLYDLFDHCFSSHRLGAIKPDPEVFARVVDACCVRPAEAVFFDDALVNVEAARRCGLVAHHVVGLSALKAALEREGLARTSGRVPAGPQLRQVALVCEDDEAVAIGRRRSSIKKTGGNR